MRRIIRSFCLLCLLLRLGLSASAQLSTTQIEIVPPNPTTSDEITVQLSGTWPDACVPQNPQVARSGRLILIATTNLATSCALVLTPWSLTVSIGRLPAGTYQLAMTYNRQVVRSKLFTVTGSGGDGGTLAAHLTIDRGCLEAGGNPIYFPGEKIGIQIRIDGADQAVATIEDILLQSDRREIRVIYRQTVPGNRTITLAPGDVGAVLGKQTLRLTAQAGDRIAQDECSFTVAPPPAPEIDVSPTSLQFGEVAVGSRGQRLLTLRNLGQADLALNALAIGGGSGSSFDFCGGTPSTAPLRPGEARQVAICFTPRSAGTAQDTVLIRSSDPNEGTVTVPLSGRGASSPPAVGTARIEILPPDPTAADEITIRLSGTWPSSCVPQSSQVSRTGAQIVIATSSPSVACNPVPTDWSLGVPVGQLPAGSYHVSLTYNQQEIQQAGFVVRDQGTPVPAAQTLLLVTGSLPNAHLGVVVGGAGDADGDGRGDVLVGTDSLLTVISGATGRSLYSIPADAPGDFEGAIAFPVSDLDGDGRDEIVVAAPHAAPEGQVDAGALYVFSGATGQRLRVIPGATAGGQFGASAALLGDINGDGKPEVVVGAPGTAADAGSVAIVSLADGLILRTFPGSGAGDRFGSAVAALDDLDGDGLPDIAVGAPLRDLGAGPHSGAVLILSTADGRVLSTFSGAEANTRLGSSLARAGDLNGDGHTDLIIGGPGRDVGGRPGAGVVFVISITDGRVLFRLEGAAAGDGFGTVVAGGGDVNGDGVPDILVGTPMADVGGRVDAGLAQVFSGTDGRLLFQLAGNAGDRLGAAAAFAGDVNADRRTDVILGAPFFDVLAGPDAGQAVVVGLPLPPVEPIP
jgi:FG-GAP-like repeat/FG-GAP repeat